MGIEKIVLSVIIVVFLGIVDASAQSKIKYHHKSKVAKDSLTYNINRQLQNPIISLIGLSLYSNLKFSKVQSEGYKVALTFQPIIPFSIGKEWNLITRTVIPVVLPIHTQSSDRYVTKGGMSDILFTTYFSPKDSKVIWGLGSSILVPSATNSVIGNEKWAAGPSGILITEAGPLTMGLLVNQLWSFAGNEKRKNINSIFFQPFVSYVTKSRITFALSTQSTHEWEKNRLATNVSPNVLKQLGGKNIPTGFQSGIKYGLSAPVLTSNWGIRASVIMIIPG